MIERAGQPYTAYQTRSVQCRNAGLQDIREAVAHVDVELQSHGKCQVEENHNALHHGRNGIYKPTTRCVQKRPKRINRTNRDIIVGPEQTLATYEATRGDQKGARVSFLTYHDTTGSVTTNSRLLSGTDRPNNFQSNQLAKRDAVETGVCSASVWKETSFMVLNSRCGLCVARRWVSRWHASMKNNNRRMRVVRALSCLGAVNDVTRSRREALGGAKKAIEKSPEEDGEDGVTMMAGRGDFSLTSESERSGSTRQGSISGGPMIALGPGYSPSGFGIRIKSLCCGRR